MQLRRDLVSSRNKAYESQISEMEAVRKNSVTDQVDENGKNGPEVDSGETGHGGCFAG